MEFKNHLFTVNLASFQFFSPFKPPHHQVRKGFRKHHMGPPLEAGVIYGIRILPTQNGGQRRPPLPPPPLPPTHRLFLGTPHTSSTVRKASVWPYSFLLTHQLAPRYYLCVTICSLGSSKFSSLVYGCQMPKRGSLHIHSPAKNQETCHVNSKVIEDTKHKRHSVFYDFSGYLISYNG